jgi:two-component sensor histidine kinase
VALRAQWLVAIVLGATLVMLPNLARGRVTIVEVIAALIWVTVDGSLLVLALRWGQRRAVSIAWTLVAGYAAVVVFGALWLALIVSTGLVDKTNAASMTLVGRLADGAYSSILILGVWGLFYVVPRVVRDARDRERERQELLREAERARVRAALEPHFVLNTLTAIGSLIADEPATARELLGDLGDLLRDVVRLSDRDRQSAADEVAWLQRYVRVLEARHRGKLAVEVLLDPSAAQLEVPVLVLQPLVENAIQHGALRRAGGGRVRVELRADTDTLRCTIEDNGPGLSGEIRDDARGLALTRRRLASAVPGASLQIASAPTGTCATLSFPLAALGVT